MDFSLGGGKRPLVAAVAACALTFSLSACSGSDDPEPTEETTTASAKPTADPAKADQADVVNLANRYWAAVVESQNTGNDSRELFADVATGGVIELQLGKVAQYKKLGLLRVGEPKITEVEAEVNGDTAQISLCLNEDDWAAEVDGQPVEAGEKFGNGAWGARVDKVDGRWLVAEISAPKDIEKSCA